MEYEDLLNKAYEKIKPVECCDRFEVMKAQGRYEGNKTIITNFFRICSSFRRDPNHFMKFLAKELASSAEISGERLVFSRRISSKDINDKIQKYACKFVFCQKCKKPDTEIEEIGEKIFIKCLACGAKFESYKV